MPNYVNKSLHKFQHPTPRRDQYAPHQWTHPNYSATNKLANTLDTSPPIPEERKHRFKQIVVTFLYYTHAVEFTMLSYINKIEDQQAHPIHNTEAVITHLLYCAATNPVVLFQFNASYMVIHIYSDASYFSKPRARSCTGGH